MKWEEFKRKGPEMSTYDGQILTDVECPRCGKKVYYNSTVVLTTYPAQYEYWCKECGWSGSAFAKWHS